MALDGSCGAGCGDGGMNGIEECDDSDNVNDDGCDAACRLELGYQSTTPRESLSNPY